MSNRVAGSLYIWAGNYKDASGQVDDLARNRASCGMASITTTMNFVKRLAVAGVLVLGVSGPVVAGFDEGVAAYDRGDYEAAYKEFLPLARTGNANAQFHLGNMYDFGWGVPQDYAAAARWYRKAAEQGDAGAQFNLGNRYDNGQGVPQDYAQAARWYQKAAEQGEAHAQFNLGIMYDNGQGVPQDYAQAARWSRKAAEQGDATAQSNLGIMYSKGQGVPQDYVLAHMWMNLAASRGNENAAKNRDLTAKRMTPADISKAQKMAREWKPKE